VLSLAGRRIEYEVFGPSAMPPRVALLHEGLGSIALWRQFPQQLAQSLGEPVLAYSRYGYGQSDVLAEPRTARFMHDEADGALAELLDEFAIASPILVGHSDGASIALIYAGHHPERPRAVVAISPHLFVEPISIESITLARQQFARSDLAERMTKYHRDAHRTFRGWNDIWLDPSFADWNIEAEVAEIRCPILAIQGEDDQYGTARQIGRIAELTAATRLLLLPGCGHSPHLDRPDEVVGAITRFIGEFAPDARSGGLQPTGA
jgi:pimeloyl-ACP methyl ester carboxylesterase